MLWLCCLWLAVVLAFAFCSMKFLSAKKMSSWLSRLLQKYAYIYIYIFKHSTTSLYVHIHRQIATWGKFLYTNVFQLPTGKTLLIYCVSKPFYDSVVNTNLLDHRLGSRSYWSNLLKRLITKSSMVYWSLVWIMDWIWVFAFRLNEWIQICICVRDKNECGTDF